MKKSLIILITMLLLCGCQNNNKVVYNENVVLDDKGKENVYKDENDIRLSLYIDGENGTLDKVGNDYHTLWEEKKDIVVFAMLFSEEQKLPNAYFQDLWEENAKKYQNKSYQVGWQIKFELKDGTKYEKLIKSPLDVEEFFDYLEIYLYDSYHQPKDTWYSHITPDEMNDETILTSMKLTAGSKYKEIISHIEVTAYTYDTSDDFENNIYRGSSKYTVNVYNE